MINTFHAPILHQNTTFQLKDRWCDQHLSCTYPASEHARSSYPSALYIRGRGEEGLVAWQSFGPPPPPPQFMVAVSTWYSVLVQRLVQVGYSRLPLPVILKRKSLNRKSHRIQHKIPCGQQSGLRKPHFD